MSRPSAWRPGGRSLLALAAVLFVASTSSRAPTRTVQTSFQPRPLSGHLPLSVNPTGVTSAEAARPFFDTFSWESFIALNWPAAAGTPGVPLNPDSANEIKSPPAGSITVWESFKESFELFGTGSEEPLPWNDTTVSHSPCAGGNDTKLLRMVGKGADVLDEVNEAFSHPLIDQNNNYVYAEVRFNRTYYDFVRFHNYYLKANLPGPSGTPLMMPASAEPDTIGAIMIKASWRFMTSADDTSRYHVVDALVLNPDTQDCSEQKVGLTGLHIAQKVTGFSEWIWSSFEQVDNVRRGHGATDSTPISFNNGTGSPATPRGWANRPPIAPPLLPERQRTPTQVTRFNPIPTTPAGNSTVDLNARYQAQLEGTPWEFYELVITQWPTSQSGFRLLEAGGIYPQNAGQPFPVNGATNTSMETFFQSQADAVGAGGNSCIQCHYGAGSTDFSWILQNDSH